MVAGIGLVATLVLGPAALLGVASANAADEADSGSKVTFTVGMLNEVDSFNPFLGIEAESYEMWALTYDYLITYSMENMSPEPGLAESWEPSEDGLTWTFHIRDGVSWSDGEPLTANDVAYTLGRIIDGGPESITWGSYLTSVTKAEATDEHTVVLTLERPNAVLPLLPMPIIPEHIWKNISEKQVKSFANEPKDGEPVVGSGPFRFVSGTAGGDTYRFEANPDYWQGAPHIDEVVFRLFKSEDPAVAALKKGEIDFVEDITALQVKALENEPNIAAHNGDSPGFDEIAFNVGAIDTETGEPMGDGNPALKDAKFRRALGYALDRDRIITTAYQGAGKPGDTIIPPAYTNFRWEPPEDEAFSFDLERAGQLLDEAGYKLGADGKRTMPDGSALDTLRLSARSDSQTSIRTMDLFKEWLGELGIDSQVNAIESSRLTDVILEGNFDAFQWGWYVEPDPDSMLSYLTCDQLGGWNDAWYCDEEYDRLYKEQNAALDENERVEKVKRMQQILFEDSPYLVTAFNTIGEAVRTDRFACFQPQPDPGGIWLFQYGIRNYLQARPAAEAGDCDGISSAVLPAASLTSTDDDGGSNSGTWLVVGGLAALVVVGGGVWGMKRRTSAGDRE